ncbi:MAG TPA: SH3 domain-containing protein [Candidatus Dormibacteraeota bacterium]|nr:SH3 domain-containing protein [Candidatus Dormibacteraeota bacterium]
MALGLVAAWACNINPSPSSHPASGARAEVTELPKGGPSNSAWVVSSVGLNVRSAPDPNSNRLATLTPSAQLTVSEKQTVGADTWLHVKTQSGVEGWVLDHPELVIHRAVSLHVEQAAGYSIVFPAEWSPSSGNPATFTGTSGPTGGSMMIQTADDPSKLAATPTTPGQELRQESPVEVYGRTTFLTIYKADAGGFEYAVKVQFPKAKAAYLFDFRQPGGSTPDTSLFKQLLGSVIVFGES